MMLRSLLGYAGPAVTAAGSLTRIAVETALPADCPACDGPLGDHRGGVCRPCWREALSQGGARGGPARPLPGLFPASLTALGAYEGRLRRIIRCLKFGELPGLGAPLGEALGGRLEDSRMRVDVVVPVPLHWRRRWRRGYNQAEVIASRVAGRLGVGIDTTVLRRTRATRSQTGRSRRERADNVRGAFEAAHRRLRGADVLLIDDVVTTGATMRECARALGAAGVHCVHAAAPARTRARVH